MFLVSVNMAHKEERSNQKWPIESIYGDNSKTGEFMVSWKGWKAHYNTMYVSHLALRLIMENHS